MGYHPRIETSEYADFLTTRTRNSELWFINNQPLEEAILGYTAKCQARYNVSLYALTIVLCAGRTQRRHPFSTVALLAPF